MRLIYDGGNDQVKINASDEMINSLKYYAKNVLIKMQNADPKYAKCWTACTITFEDLTPVFHWSSKEDMDLTHVIQVTVPIQTVEYGVVLIKNDMSELCLPTRWPDWKDASLIGETEVRAKRAVGFRIVSYN